MNLGKDVDDGKFVNIRWKVFIQKFIGKLVLCAENQVLRKKIIKIDVDRELVARLHVYPGKTILYQDKVQLYT